MQVFSKEVLKDWHNSVLVLFSNTWDDMTDYYVMPNLLFYFYLFTDLFFFLECSSCPYHMFYLVQCLICTPWTCLCPHLKCNSQYIVFISSFHFYLFTDLFFFLRMFVLFPLYIPLCTIPCLCSLDMSLSPLFDSWCIAIE